MNFEPSIYCPTHGKQPWRTRCKWCYYDPIKEAARKAAFENALENYIPITESGCWIWLGGVNGAGYPRIFKRPKEISATRFFYQHHKGPIPKGQFVCHTCDVPLCVNPAHLFAASARENMQDMSRKGRATKGQRKLNAALRLEIGTSPDSTGVLACRFNLTTRYVRQLKAKFREPILPRAEMPASVRTPVPHLFIPKE